MIETHGSNLAGAELLKIIERLENLTIDRDVIGEDMRDAMKKAKSIGFEPRIIRELVKQRRQDAATRADFEALVESYKRAIGMLDGTPLGAAGVRTVAGS